MKFIMNYYFFIYICKEIYIINMIQSQPKLGDFVSLSDTYIQVVCNIFSELTLKAFPLFFSERNLLKLLTKNLA